MAITYNIAAVDSLVLDAPTLAKIFNGTIKRWDDPALTSFNASMPAEDIKVIYRSDASGTTYNFQSYLQAASGGAWTQGVAKNFNGGIGTGAEGNKGTAALVKTTEGAISYNELSFALEQGLYAAEIKTPASRRSLRPVRIGTDTVGKTIKGAKITGQGNNLVLDLSSFYNPAQPDVYPIVLATYEIVCSKYPNPEDTQAIKSFLQTAIGPGQIDLNRAGYIPLSPDFQARVSSRRRRHHLSSGLPRYHFAFGCFRSRCRHQARMNNVIATTNPINTHSTTAWSTHEPIGGLPGRKLRSGTMANSIAAYQVPNGGKNVVRPNNIGMATHNAKTGRAIIIRQIPRSRINGPFDLCNVMITLSRLFGFSVSSASWTRRTFTSQPSNDPVTSIRAHTLSW